MPADEVTHGTEVDESRVRTGPRHAAPKRPLFTRFQMPAGKAIATVAMPTAVIMGMGFTSTLAIADTNNTSPAASKSLAEDYKNCVSALDTASPSPSASASDKATDPATPSATASSGTKDSSSSGTSSSSDSGSDEAAKPTPSASKSSSSSDGSGSSSGSSGSGATATPSPSASTSSGGGGLLGSIGDAITGILGGGSTSSSSSDSTASATPSPSASTSAGSSSKASGSSASSSSSSSKDSGSDTVSKTVKKVTDTVKGTTDTATKAAGEVTKDATKAAGDATSSASPSPSASSSASADDCKAATDDVSGVDNKVTVADDPWYLSASSLTLNRADYQGIVEVRTASGKTKKVLKYVISGGTDIGDLHQTVKDTKIDKTYHVQAAPGSKSTIRDGDTTMYTESISGNLFGLIPITFSPDNPPPLNIPLIYFTNVKVVQAGQFGGTLTVPGMHVYTTDGTG